MITRPILPLRRNRPREIWGAYFTTSSLKICPTPGVRRMRLSASWRSSWLATSPRSTTSWPLMKTWMRPLEGNKLERSIESRNHSRVEDDARHLTDQDGHHHSGPHAPRGFSPPQLPPTLRGVRVRDTKPREVVLFHGCCVWGFGGRVGGGFVAASDDRSAASAAALTRAAAASASSFSKQQCLYLRPEPQ